MIKLEVFIEGVQKRIAVIVKKKRSPCRDYIESLGDKERNRLMALMNRLADRGFLKNKELFRNLKKNIYEFKVGSARVFCFFYQDLVICTHGVKKPKKRRLQNEIKKVQKMRERLINQEESGNENKN